MVVMVTLMGVEGFVACGHSGSDMLWWCCVRVMELFVVLCWVLWLGGNGPCSCYKNFGESDYFGMFVPCIVVFLCCLLLHRVDLNSNCYCDSNLLLFLKSYLFVQGLGSLQWFVGATYWQNGTLWVALVEVA
jgi:hypothetical protein